MNSRFIPVIIALLAATHAGGQSASRPITATDLMRHMSVLANDSMEGRLMGSPGNAKARAYLVKMFTDAGLKPIGTSLEQPFESKSARDTTPRRGVNIAGVFRGRTHPDRYIVVSAHYDHVGVRNGEIYNGADDNASGAGALVEIAKQLRAKQPDNSIIIVAFDGEESGLRGARAFVANPPVPLSSIVMNVNMDMVGRNAQQELYASGTSYYPFLKPYLDSVVTRSSIHLKLGHDDPKGPPHDNWLSQSDQGAFHDVKIPFIYFGVEDHPDYHKPTDDVERIMPEFYAGAINTVLDAVRVFDANLASIAQKSPR